MSKKKETLWDAPAHTIAKIEILRGYLQVWFSVLGRQGLDVWFIDGFAGPGEYSNYPDGSPVAALRAADAALESAGGSIAGRIHCVFMEENRKRFENLSARLEKHPKNTRVERHLFHGTFRNGMAWLKTQSDNPFTQGSPLFVFADPFGTSGLPFEILKTVLARPRSEVLVNLDSDGVRRVLAAREDANHLEQLDTLYGDRSWESRLDPSFATPKLIQEAVDLYRKRLSEIAGVNYTFAFEMRSVGTLVNYHLVFATRHRLGLEKMKEVMKAMDQKGAYSFCDAHVGQHEMFKFNDPAVHALELYDRFRSRRVPFVDVDRYALNESPFTNSKKMLAVLEEKELIQVESSDPRRRKGKFADGKILAITFV